MNPPPAASTARAATVPLLDRIQEMERFLFGFVPSGAYPDDEAARATCQLALAAVRQGNFGIGCILKDPSGRIVSAGHNQVFVPFFRSDLHGEMVVMDQFENANPAVTSMKGYTLYTSLESCPMCMARLITSGVETVLYVAPDLGGGMVHLAQSLPPVWKPLMDRQKWGAARCDPVLAKAAHDIFMLNAEALNARLMAR